MKALILAAGAGLRLGKLTQDKPKALVPIAGVPLLLRTIESLRKADITEVYVVVGYKREDISKIGGNYKETRIHYVRNEDWEKGNLYSLLAGRDHLKEKFLLCMCDHIFDPRIVRGLIGKETGKETKIGVLLAVEKKKYSEEDTKVLVKENKIIEIGKDVEGNFVDTGFFLCSPKIFDYAETAVDNGRGELSDCINVAAQNKDAEIFDISEIPKYVSKMRKDIEPFWKDVDTEEDIDEAKKLLIDASSKGASDFLAHYVHRPIENKLVCHLSDLKITPNQLTIITNIVAYTITFLFLFGHLLIASILTFLVGILDGLDGKLARVRGQTSMLGSMEHSFDLLFEFSWIIALSIFLYMDGKGGLPIILCSLIIVFIAFYRHCYDQFRRAMGKSLDDYGDFERKFRRIAGRRNLYNIHIFIGVIVGFPIYSLMSILIHSIITAAVYSYRSCKHLYAKDKFE